MPPVRRTRSVAGRDEFVQCPEMLVDALVPGLFGLPDGSLPNASLRMLASSVAGSAQPAARLESGETARTLADTAALASAAAAALSVAGARLS